jgi:hypothetical protein
MKTKISILFYASASNQLKSGLVPIYLQLFKIEALKSAQESSRRIKME